MGLDRKRPEHFFILLHWFPDSCETCQESWLYSEPAFPKPFIFAPPTMRGYELSTIVAETKCTQNATIADNAELGQPPALVYKLGL
ncbi:hypothetical protein TRVA0_087S00188 [Trichomonascus vanleenenianus]|uniref:uncharacterized protein n=1 Tax=Trichomonascus vanleenenianus TaxID=2268995 RepID=UPI003ECA78CA